MQSGEQRIGLSRQAVQQRRPVGVDLFVEQLLGPLPIADRDQEVLLAAIREAFLLQSAIEPLSAIETDAHGEGEPTLQAHVAQAELLMLEVVVEVLTSRGFGDEDDVAAIVFADAEGAAAFDATEDGDAAGGETALLGDGQGGGFFVDVGAVEVMDAVAVGGGQRLGLADQRFAELFDVGGVLLDE